MDGGRLSPGNPGGRRAEVSSPAEAAGDQAAEVRPKGVEDVSARHDVGRRVRRGRWSAYHLRAFSDDLAGYGPDSPRAGRPYRIITTSSRRACSKIFAADRDNSILRIPLDERRRADRSHSLGRTRDCPARVCRIKLRWKSSSELRWHILREGSDMALGGRARSDSGPAARRRFSFSGGHRNQRGYAA